MGYRFQAYVLFSNIWSPGVGKCATKSQVAAVNREQYVTSQVIGQQLLLSLCAFIIIRGVLQCINNNTEPKGNKHKHMFTTVTY